MYYVYDVGVSVWLVEETVHPVFLKLVPLFLAHEAARYDDLHLFQLSRSLLRTSSPPMPGMIMSRITRSIDRWWDS